MGQNFPWPKGCAKKVGIGPGSRRGNSGTTGVEHGYEGRKGGSIHGGLDLESVRLAPGTVRLGLVVNRVRENRLLRGDEISNPRPVRPGLVGKGDYLRDTVSLGSVRYFQPPSLVAADRGLPGHRVREDRLFRGDDYQIPDRLVLFWSPGTPWGVRRRGDVYRDWLVRGVRLSDPGHECPAPLLSSNDSNDFTFSNSGTIAWPSFFW